MVPGQPLFIGVALFIFYLIRINMGFRLRALLLYYTMHRQYYIFPADKNPDYMATQPTSAVKDE